MSGPSCVNARDWSFVVVTDPEKLAQMADANGRPAEPLRKAAAGILVCGDLDRAFRFAKDYWSLTEPLPPRTSALLHRSWGLAQSGWAPGPDGPGGGPAKAVRSAGDHCAHSIIALGYPEADLTAPRESRYEDDRVHFNQW